MSGKKSAIKTDLSTVPDYHLLKQQCYGGLDIEVVLEKINNPEMRLLDLVFLDTEEEGFQTPKHSFIQSEEKEFQGWLDEIESPPSAAPLVLQSIAKAPVEMSFGQPQSESFDILVDTPSEQNSPVKTL